MKRLFNHFAASIALLGIVAIPCEVAAETARTVTTTTTVSAPVIRRHVVVRKRHPVRKTINGVGIGAAGGAAAGALIGGGTGAAIGAVAGAGAGAIYDQHEKRIGK